MKTFSKTASIVLALTMVQCACGICANAEEAQSIDYSGNKAGIHYSDTTTGVANIDVAKFTSGLKSGLRNAEAAVNKVDQINGQFNATNGNIYAIEKGNRLVIAKGVSGVTGEKATDPASVNDAITTNAKLPTKLPLTKGVTPTVDVAASTNDTVGVAVSKDGRVVAGKAVIGTTETVDGKTVSVPDTVVVTAKNKLGSVTNTTKVSDTATVVSATPKVIAQNASRLVGVTPMASALNFINAVRFTGKTDTNLTNSLTTTIGGADGVNVTDENTVTNTAALKNGMNAQIKNKGIIGTTTTATPAVSQTAKALLGLISKNGVNLPRVITKADVTTTTDPAVSTDGESISASTTVKDTASVNVEKLNLVNHNGKVVVTNTVTPDTAAVAAAAINTAKAVAGGKESVSDAIKSAAGATVPKTISISGNGKTTVDITFGKMGGARVVTDNQGIVNVTAKSDAGTANAKVEVKDSNTAINFPSASTILSGLFGTKAA